MFTNGFKSNQIKYIYLPQAYNTNIENIIFKNQLEI